LHLTKKDTSGVARPKLGGGEISDFRRATIFLFWTPLLNAKMARYAKNLTMSPLGCAYEGYVMVI